LIEALLGSAIRISTPISFAALGESVLERTGRVNVGIEGTMLSGAFVAYVAAASGHGHLFAMLAAAAAGATFGCIFGVLVSSGRVDQIVAGIGINLLAAGLTSGGIRWFAASRGYRAVDTIGTVEIPWLSRLPWVGPVLFSRSPVWYSSLLVAICLWWFLAKTRAGLVLTATGFAEDGVALSGSRPRRVIFLTSVFSGTLAGIGGGDISLGSAGIFVEGGTAGRGFLALAITLVAARKPLAVPLAAGAYGLAEAYALQTMTTSASQLAWYRELLPALPFAITLIVYAIASVSSARRSAPS
jgi:ABC-type uncharacterized transport system permease subunit